jgi:hypothetical protein
MFMIVITSLLVVKLLFIIILIKNKFIIAVSKFIPYYWDFFKVGALEGNEELTPLGHHLAKLPVDVLIGKVCIK